MTEIQAQDGLPPMEEAVEEMLAEVRAYQATPHYARVVEAHTPEETGAVPPRSS